MDGSNVMEFVDQLKKDKNPIDIFISNYDSIINIFKNYYKESLNDQNVYTKFIISLNNNGEVKKYDLNSLIECKNDIQNNLMNYFRIYVCSCAKSTSDNYLFSSLDMTLSKDYKKIKVRYFDEFNREKLKKYKEEIKNLLKDYCDFTCCLRKDEYIKANHSDDYEIALSNYLKAGAEKFDQIDVNKILNDIDKKNEELDEKESYKKRTSIQYQLSNVLLFDYVFYDWYMFNQLLSFGPDSMKKFLYDEWNRVKDILLKENKFIINDAEKNVTVNDFDITVNKTSKGTTVYFFTFPDYEFTDAASKYVALALTYGKPRYFTLEYSIHHLSNTPSWVIGEFYIEDNKVAHRNYGSVDNMRLSFFAGYILEILDDFEGAKKKDDEHRNKSDYKDEKKTLLISESGKYEYTLLGKKYEFSATKINDNEIEIEVSDYGLAQKKEDGSISLLDKVNNFSLKKGEKLILRTQTTDYGEEITIEWN